MTRFRPPSPTQARRRLGPAALLVGALCMGLLLGTLVFAPARWLAMALHSATNGQLQLLETRGTVWRGTGQLRLSGGAGSQSASLLPQGLQWHFGLSPSQGALTLAIGLPCCSAEPLRLRWLPGLHSQHWEMVAHQSEWPAELLQGLGTPWNTLGFTGQLKLDSPGMDLRLAQGQFQVSGGLTLQALGMASRLSRLRPLGSYQLRLSADDPAQGPHWTLQTLNGALQLQGKGQWVAGRLRFEGQAEAAPGSEAALSNLLNIVGRRQGPISVIKIG